MVDTISCLMSAFITDFRMTLHDCYVKMNTHFYYKIANIRRYHHEYSSNS